MNSSLGVLCFTIILLTIGSSSTAENNCQISEDELSKIEDTLVHIDRPIYAEETEPVDDSDECARMLRSIHLQLRRLTQKYKLINKGYVKVAEFQKMTKEYEDQLTKLNEEVEQFKIGAESSAKQKMAELREDIAKLEKNVSLLHKDLEGKTDEWGKVSKDLCLTYLESNQLDNAKDKVRNLAAKYLMQLVEEFMNNSAGNLLPVFDVATVVPDLDDRGQVYKTVYEYLLMKKRLEGEDSLFLEAEIQKLSASFHSGSSITDERRQQLQNLLEKLNSMSNKIFKQWTLSLGESKNLTIFKNAIDRLFLSQMEKFAEHVSARYDYYSLKHFLKLLVVSNNYYKIAAYKNLINTRKGLALAVIMIDIMAMERTELRYDSHVPDTIEEIYNDTIRLLPESLRSIISCQKSVKIMNQDTNQCILATEEKVEVKHPTLDNILGHFKRVTTTPNNCTIFRLELSPEKSSIRIISSGGEPLTSINSKLPDSTWLGRVGAPYTNNGPNNKLDHSQDWILEATHARKTIKIKTEFSAYQTQKTMDHLVVQEVGNVSHVVVARFGLRGMTAAKIDAKRAEWRFECAL